MKCFVTQKPIHRYEAVKGKEIQQEIFKLIQQDYPAISEEDYVSIKVLNKYRRLFFANLISQEKGEIEKLDQDVIEAIRNNSILSENIKEETVKTLTIGEKIADKVATFGGSWTFIVVFFVFFISVDVT
ncbi:hypothetical protein [Empedobacter stercoris]|uniref:hypothetical protein n=1 Tax=Empedobacter stercoris TaxID=1628248 RepID=UPI0021A998E9|nr:hypothetical protein [Empedobacter stercoris]